MKQFSLYFTFLIFSFLLSINFHPTNFLNSQNFIIFLKITKTKIILIKVNISKYIQKKLNQEDLQRNNKNSDKIKFKLPNLDY